MTSRSTPVPLRDWAVVPDFFAGVDEMRRAYDELFFDRDSIVPERFVWDYWHVPDMFTYLRALPQAVFPKLLFYNFMLELRKWGGRQLACRDVVLPLLNCHIDDCWHDIHSDAERGRWAYVFSLTDWARREFTGGETMVFSPRAMDWNASVGSDEGARAIISAIPARYNQLTIFDASLPHGVRRVVGPRDPHKGRLAMAGWFSTPGVVTSESIANTGLAEQFEHRSAEIQSLLSGVAGLAGRLVAHVRLMQDGSVASVEFTVNATTGVGSIQDTLQTVESIVRANLTERRFSRMPDDAWVSLPFEVSTG